MYFNEKLLLCKSNPFQTENSGIQNTRKNNTHIRVNTEIVIIFSPKYFLQHQLKVTSIATQFSSSRYILLKLIEFHDIN